MAANPVTASHAHAASPGDGPSLLTGERRGKGGLVLGLGAVVALGVIATILFLVPRKTSIAPGPEGTAAAARASPTGAPRGVLPDAVILGMVARSADRTRSAAGPCASAGRWRSRRRTTRAGFTVASCGSWCRTTATTRPARWPAMKEVVEDRVRVRDRRERGTATAAVAIPVRGQKDAVFFGALSGGDLLRKNPPDRHVFNFRASLAREAEAAVRYLVEVRRIAPKRIAVLAQDDEFGASGRKGAVQQLADVRPRAGGRAPAHLPAKHGRRAGRRGEAPGAGQGVRRGGDGRHVQARRHLHPEGQGRRTEPVLHGGLRRLERARGGAGRTPGRSTRTKVLITQVVPVPTSQASMLIRYRQALEKYAAGREAGLHLAGGVDRRADLPGGAPADRSRARHAAADRGAGEDPGWDIGIGGADRRSARPITRGATSSGAGLLQSDGTYRQVDLE